MPVWKFRNSEEARRALWTESSDPDLPERLRRLFAFVKRLSRSRAPRGVRRFNSVEEANADRALWPSGRP